MSLQNNYFNHGIKGIRKFYWNRFIRILPLFYFISIFVLFYKHFFDGCSINFLISRPFKEFFMLQWNHNYSLNGVFWTLGIEMQFYFLAPIFLFLVKRKSLVNTCLILGCIMVISLIGKEFWDASDFKRADCRNLLGNINHFLTGILVANLYSKIKANVFKFQIRYIITLGGMALLSLLFCNDLYFRHNLQFLGWKGILTVDFFCFLVLLLHITFEAKRLRSSIYLLPLLWLGVLSYGIYAWHGAICAISIFFRENFVSNLIASITLAYLTYILIEKPLKKYKALSNQIFNIKEVLN